MEKLPLYKEPEKVEEYTPPVFHTREQVYIFLAKKINEIIDKVNNLNPQ